jgi:hypothetical protein
MQERAPLLPFFSKSLLSQHTLKSNSFLMNASPNTKVKSPKKLYFIFCGILILSGCGLDIETSHNASTAFEATFGAAPPSTVSNIVGEFTIFRDSAHCYLSFNCSSNTFYSLIGTNFTSISQATFAQEASGTVGATPAWWTPTNSSTADFLSSTTFHPIFMFGGSLGSYDFTNKTAFIYWYSGE